MRKQYGNENKWHEMPEINIVWNLLIDYDLLKTIS